jgi:hemerythrin
MKWNESLSIGVAKIDSQHRKLIGMVKQLENALDGSNTLKEMGRTLKSVVDYTNYHFKDEEDLMAQIKWPIFKVSSKYRHQQIIMGMSDLITTRV